MDHLQKKNLRSQKKAKGFAVLFVLTFTAVILFVVGDVLFQTQIVAKHSMNVNDQIQAQGTALTGVSIAKVLLKFQTKANSQEFKDLPIKFDELFSSLNGKPIGGDSPLFQIDETVAEELSDVIEPEVYKMLKKIPGYFELNVSSENCKFNLNLLKRSAEGWAKFALRNLFSTNYALQVLSIYGLNPENLIENLEKYISDEINRPLTSVQEIRMVEGFQYDDIYNMYESYFTVWTDKNLSTGRHFENIKALNINCASPELLAGLFRDSPLEPIDPELWKGFSEKKFTDINKFIDFLVQTNPTGFDNIKRMVSALVTLNDSVYRIESNGVFNNTSQKLNIILHVDDKGNFVTDYNQWSQ